MLILSIFLAGLKPRPLGRKGAPRNKQSDVALSCEDWRGIHPLPIFCALRITFMSLIASQKLGLGPKLYVGTKSMQKQHQHEEPRSSGNEYTNSLVVKITAHFTSPCYFLYALISFTHFATS